MRRAGLGRGVRQRRARRQAVAAVGGRGGQATQGHPPRRPARPAALPRPTRAHLAGGPVVKGNKVLRPHAQQLAAVDGLGGVGRADGQRLLEVAVDLDCGLEGQAGCGRGLMVRQRRDLRVEGVSAESTARSASAALPHSQLPCPLPRADALVLLLSRVANTFESSPHTNSKACSRGGGCGCGRG